MKYPIKQQQVFEEFIKKLNPIYKVEQANIHTLHYICFQQHSEGQKHNWLYQTKEGLKKGFQLNEKEEATKFFESDFDFKLYPDGCNDNHVETMVKYTFKNLGLKINQNK